MLSGYEYTINLQKNRPGKLLKRFLKYFTKQFYSTISTILNGTRIIDS